MIDKNQIINLLHELHEQAVDYSGYASEYFREKYKIESELNRTMKQIELIEKEWNNEVNSK